MEERTKSVRDGRRQPLTKEELQEIVARWRNGETLKQIAESYGLEYATFQRQTKHAWGSEIKAPEPPKYKVYSKLNEHQLAEAVRRWEHGERWQEISKDYGVSYEGLLKQTRPYRKGKNSGGKLNIEVLRNAKLRRDQGDSLTDIATDLNVSRLALRLGMKHIEINAPEPPCVLLNASRLTDALNRYERGEPLVRLAKTHNISRNKLCALFIYECWRRGDSIKAIAERFGKSRSIVREYILKHTQQEPS